MHNVYLVDKVSSYVIQPYYLIMIESMGINHVSYDSVGKEEMKSLSSKLQRLIDQAHHTPKVPSLR
jgi:hypothetical protein